MSDRCTDNQRKAEQCLSRFQGVPLGHLIEGKAVAGGHAAALENRTPIDGTVINSVETVSYTHLTLPTNSRV